MRVSELQDRQTVRARWGRAGEEDVNWGPWQDATLYVQRFQGQVACVGLRNVPWAEYGPRDFVEAKDAYQGGERGAPNGLFLVEDYYLEVEGLTER